MNLTTDQLLERREHTVALIDFWGARGLLHDFFPRFIDDERRIWLALSRACYALDGTL